MGGVMEFDTVALQTQMTEMMLTYGPRLIGALVLAIIGFWVIKGINRGVIGVLDKKHIDPSLKPFLISIIDVLLKVVLGVSVLSMLGLEMTSFIAVLGAAGLAVGMALSGTLQNFAGRVMILLFKPFEVGDFVEAQGHAGVVREIQIFNTIYKTGDNKTIIIPNGGLSTSSMVNYSMKARRRVVWVFGIAYGDDVDQARAVMKRLCDEDERILKDPEVMIVVSALSR